MLQQNPKREFRTRMKQMRAAESETERLLQHQKISGHVLGEMAYQQAKTIFCYCSSGDEIDTYAVLLDALAQGKRVCVPKTCGRGVMQARMIRCLAQLCPGKYGISEPEDCCPVVSPEEIDLCIVPCLAADCRGYRLGYGGGYYDRFLPQTSAAKMLLCEQSRIFDEIPVEEHDIPCDILITESQVIYPHEK